MKFVPHAAAISLVATQSMAGGLADSIVETPVAEPEAMAAPAGSSDWIIPALIVGALIAVAVSSDDDDDDAAPAPTMEAPAPVMEAPAPPPVQAPPS
ncbi:hypothetical protein [Yoonia sp.]|uniref:hypothetical protein n=1 Tax=Yoonia sp. TaxID=2212373 RepID=UPI00358E4907